MPVDSIETEGAQWKEHESVHARRSGVGDARTDKVVLDPEEFDFLVPAILSDTFSAHGAVSRVPDVGFPRILNVKHVHRAFGDELLGLFPFERRQQLDIWQKSCGAQGQG